MMNPTSTYTAETKEMMDKKIKFHNAMDRMSPAYLEQRLDAWRKKGHKNPIFYFYDRNAHVRMLYSPIFENEATGTCIPDTNKRMKDMCGKRKQTKASWTLHSKYDDTRSKKFRDSF